MARYPEWIEWKEGHCVRSHCDSTVPLGEVYCWPCVREINRQNGEVRPIFTDLRAVTQVWP